MAGGEGRVMGIAEEEDPAGPGEGDGEGVEEGDGVAEEELEIQLVREAMGMEEGLTFRFSDQVL